MTLPFQEFVRLPPAGWKRRNYDMGQTRKASLDKANQETNIWRPGKTLQSLSWIVMVCHELVVDWGNSGFLVMMLILWFFQNKATYQKQSYHGVMKMIPMMEEDDFKQYKA